MIKLVNTTTGERTDLRFVDELRLVGIPPELHDEFMQLAAERRRIREFLSGALGVPADVLQGKMSALIEAAKD